MLNIVNTTIRKEIFELLSCISGHFQSMRSLLHCRFVLSLSTFFWHVHFVPQVSAKNVISVSCYGLRVGDLGVLLGLFSVLVIEERL